MAELVEGVVIAHIKQVSCQVGLELGNPAEALVLLAILEKANKVPVRTKLYIFTKKFKNTSRSTYMCGSACRGYF